MIVPATWKVPDVLRSRLGTKTVGRQRAIVEEGHLLLVLHKPPGPNDESREGMLFWRDLSGTWSGSKGATGAAGLRQHVHSYAEQEGKLSQAYDDATNTTDLFEILETLTPLTRAARNMHHALQTARDQIGADPLLIEVRDQASDVERNFEILLEDVRNALQYRIARGAETQAKLQMEALKASHRLNILAALFFPITAVGSIFGMNFVLGTENSTAMFWLTVGAGIASGIGTALWVGRKS